MSNIYKHCLSCCIETWHNIIEIMHRFYDKNQRINKSWYKFYQSFSSRNVSSSELLESLKSKRKGLFIHYSLQMFHFRDGLIWMTFSKTIIFVIIQYFFFVKKKRFNLNRSIETSENFLNNMSILFAVILSISWEDLTKMN